MTQDAHSADPRKQSYTHSIHRERILAPSDIRMGHAELPEAALFLQSRGYRRIFTTRYYSCPLWPHLLVAAMERWGQGIPRLSPAQPARS